MKFIISFSSDFEFAINLLIHLHKDSTHFITFRSHVTPSFSVASVFTTLSATIPIYEKPISIYNSIPFRARELSSGDAVGEILYDRVVQKTARENEEEIGGRREKEGSAGSVGRKQKITERTIWEITEACAGFQSVELDRPHTAWPSLSAFLADRSFSLRCFVSTSTPAFCILCSPFCVLPRALRATPISPPPPNKFSVNNASVRIPPRCTAHTLLLATSVAPHCRTEKAPDSLETRMDLRNVRTNLCAGSWVCITYAVTIRAPMHQHRDQSCISCTFVCARDQNRYRVSSNYWRNWKGIDYRCEYKLEMCDTIFSGGV